MGEPPVIVDPRRWGALFGVVGGLVFIFSYTAPLGQVISVGVKVVGVGLALLVLYGHYVRPMSLGPFREASRTALFVYVGCVVGELAAIAAGSRLLARLDQVELRPALIAAVVGAHFVPFAWAFGERMFYSLGFALIALGSLGLIAGYAGITHAAEAAAVLSGVVMLALLALHARGRFARGSGEVAPGQGNAG